MYKVIKSVLDIFFAIIGMFFMWPIFLLVIIAIKIDSKGPAIFKQLRTGKNGKQIYVYKFRSMYGTNVAFDKERPVISDDNINVTRVGKFIRKVKLDESIQLLNILKGEMSFVGPRPLKVEYYDSYTDWEKRKLLVKPGLTGLSQIKGNGFLNIKERNYYDVVYAEKPKFFLDVKIFFTTFAIIFRGEERYINHVEPELINELEMKEGYTYNPDDYAEDPTALS